MTHHLFLCTSAGVQPRETSLAPTSQARRTASTPLSPCASGDTSPKRESRRLSSTPPASPSNPPTVCTELVPAAANSAALGPFCPHWKAAQGCSAMTAWNPSAPSRHPWPTLTRPTAHSGSPGSLRGSCHSRSGHRPLWMAGQGGSASLDLPPMVPEKWSWPLPQGCMHLLEAPSSPERDSISFSAPWKPLKSCQPRGGERAKEGEAEAPAGHTGHVVVLQVSRLRQGMRGKKTG